jgi:hypothetical protein
MGLVGQPESAALIALYPGSSSVGHVAGSRGGLFSIVMRPGKAPSSATGGSSVVKASRLLMYCSIDCMPAMRRYQKWIENNSFTSSSRI